MGRAVGLLETTGLTPALVALDAMVKSAPVRVTQVEVNDMYGVCVKITGSVDAVSAAIPIGRQAAEAMQGRPIGHVITDLDDEARRAVDSPPEYNPLIQQDVVFLAEPEPSINEKAEAAMSQDQLLALGLIETQGFTAVFEAIDTACKAANVEVVGKEKLGGGYVTVVVRGELSAVTAAIDAGKSRVGDLGKLIAAHVIARPSRAVLSLLPKL
ncbi:MAG: BMC domain-containing protein [Thermoguttaceae bacterium]